MYDVILRVKLNKAKDMENSRFYQKRVKLLLPPIPGTKIRLEKRSIIITGYSQEPGLPPVVELEKQNQTFQGASFTNLCNAFEELGFTHVNPQED